MFIRIANLFDRHDLEALRSALDARELFVDGRTTAGWHARAVKANLQAERSSTVDGALKKIEATLRKHEVFVAAARPKSFPSLLISRYEPGMTYGSHVDDALMGGVRTDLSFTLFLSDPAGYTGGALVVEDTYGEREIKLPAGELFLYPSTTLHRVEPVTDGVRLAAVGWVRSFIRDHGQREVLFDLETALRTVHREQGKTPLFDTLVKTRTNLLRMWAED